MSFNFFSINQKPNTVLGIQTASYPEATPLGDGVIDVYNNFRWKNKGSIDEVPSIILTEYKLNTGARTANLASILVDAAAAGLDGAKKGSFDKLFETAKVTAAKLIQGDPYQGLYKGDPTKFQYHLPYLKGHNEDIRGGSLKNAWTDDQNLVSDFLEKNLPTITGVAKTLGQGVSYLKNEQFGAETIQKYGGTTARSLTIKFPLFNTYSLKEANDNFSFISLFNFQNLKTRTSYMTWQPPKVYTVDTMASGGIYMPIAYVSNFDVKNLGSLKKISDSSGGTGINPSGYRLMPDAYLVTITLTELIPETTNIMQGVLGYNKVQVIDNRISGGNVNGSGEGVFDFLNNSGLPSSGSGTTGDPIATGVDGTQGSSEQDYQADQSEWDTPPESATTNRGKKVQTYDGLTESQANELLTTWEALASTPPTQKQQIEYDKYALEQTLDSSQYTPEENGPSTLSDQLPGMDPYSYGSPNLNWQNGVPGMEVGENKLSYQEEFDQRMRAMGLDVPQQNSVNVKDLEEEEINAANQENALTDYGNKLSVMEGMMPGMLAQAQQTGDYRTYKAMQDSINWMYTQEGKEAHGITVTDSQVSQNTTESSQININSSLPEGNGYKVDLDKPFGLTISPSVEPIKQENNSPEYKDQEIIITGTKLPTTDYPDISVTPPEISNILMEPMYNDISKYNISKNLSKTEQSQQETALQFLYTRVIPSSKEGSSGMADPVANAVSIQVSDLNQTFINQIQNLNDYGVDVRFVPSGKPSTNGYTSYQIMYRVSGDTYKLLHSDETIQTSVGPVQASDFVKGKLSGPSWSQRGLKAMQEMRNNVIRSGFIGM